MGNELLHESLCSGHAHIAGILRTRYPQPSLYLQCTGSVFVVWGASFSVCYGNKHLSDQKDGMEAVGYPPFPPSSLSSPLFSCLRYPLYGAWNRHLSYCRDALRRSRAWTFAPRKSCPRRRLRSERLWRGNGTSRPQRQSLLTLPRPASLLAQITGEVVLLSGASSCQPHPLTLLRNLRMRIALTSRYRSRSMN